MINRQLLLGLRMFSTGIWVPFWFEQFQLLFQFLVRQRGVNLGEGQIDVASILASKALVLK